MIQIVDMPDFPGHSLMRVNATFGMQKNSYKFAKFCKVVFFQLSHVILKPSMSEGCLPLNKKTYTLQFITLLQYQVF